MTTASNLQLFDEVGKIEDFIREGKFQRGLSLIAALSSVLSGLEVGYEHYKGSYSRRIMYSPVILSGLLFGAGMCGFFSRRAARSVLRSTSILTLADSLLGFYFHVRGIQRKPGGWRLPIVNIVMGPPIFAPLLFGTSAYLGLLASYMRREEDFDERNSIELNRSRGKALNLPARSGSASIGWRQEIREGRFQKHVAAITVLWSFFSGFEAWYSHYKNNFRYKAQWTPVILSPVLMITAAASIPSRKIAKRLLPAVSIITMVNGGIGFAYHARGVIRRPGGLKKWVYNIMYGPPIFAPLLFAACGTLGLLASLLRRER